MFAPFENRMGLDPPYSLHVRSCVCFMFHLSAVYLRASRFPDSADRWPAARGVGSVPPTDYRLLATDLTGRCTLGFAFASFSSFLQLVSVFTARRATAPRLPKPVPLEATGANRASLNSNVAYANDLRRTWTDTFSNYTIVRALFSSTDHTSARAIEQEMSIKVFSQDDVYEFIRAWEHRFSQHILSRIPRRLWGARRVGH